MSALDNPNAPCRACPGCNVLTDYRDLIRVDARTVRCAECVRESVALDDDAAALVPFDLHPLAAQFDARDEGLFVAELGPEELDTFAEMEAAQVPELSRCGT